MHQPSYYVDVCQRLTSQMVLLADLHKCPRQPIAHETPDDPPARPHGPKSVYEVWLASREIPGQNGVYLVPGAQRRLTCANARLARVAAQNCVFDFVSLGVLSMCMAA
jgi:hypothetical protein